jgi:hypothetical protein
MLAQWKRDEKTNIKHVSLSSIQTEPKLVISIEQVIPDIIPCSYSFIAKNLSHARKKSK